MSTPTVTWFNPQQLADINLRKQIDDRLSRGGNFTHWRYSEKPDKDLAELREQAKAQSILRKMAT